MIYFQVAIILMLVMGWMVLSARAQPAEISAGKVRPAVTSDKIKAMSREDIRQALERIETKTPPPEKMGAMCNKMALPAKYLEYVCPLDGEKTNYSKDSRSYWQVEEILILRKLVNELRSSVKGISFSLDERKLCSRCFPYLTDTERTLSLVVQYGDGTLVRTDGVTTQDLRYLSGFFSDGLSYQTSNDGRLPLKSVEARLKELLGEKGAGE